MASIQEKETDSDSERIIAERLLSEALANNKKGTADGAREAIVKWEAALSLWKKLDKYWVGYTQLSLGLAYTSLGERRNALEYFNEALALFLQIGDKSGESSALNNIGMVYDFQGEKRKALDYHTQALAIDRQLNDRKGQASVLSNIAKIYSDFGDK